MVSFQSPISFSKEQRNMISFFDDSPSSSSSSDKKRKREDDNEAEGVLDDIHQKSPRSENDLGLQLDTPLPCEWQRFLDIQSGQIHFYNTRTHKRTLKDPRERSTTINPQHEPPSHSGHMSLDLELNLLCGHHSSTEPESIPKKHKQNQDSADKPQINLGIFFIKKNDTMEKKQTRSSSSERDEDQKNEMVATVCSRCHMLVILCKSSPACPNCKFMHPQDQLKPRLNLLC
ncbi:hypothetical protein Droror1_Dr00011307 [Drosera rotundifolia]